MTDTVVVSAALSLGREARVIEPYSVQRAYCGRSQRTELGELIPFGAVSRDTAVLGDEHTPETTDETKSVPDQIAALEEEIAALKIRIADPEKRRG
ncbi:hypothetical protein MRS76_24040 [Rhizobiaceae bacterium n13]|uniref:Uncharacterized protein n=1 Tax=Ferirhizobium litorale TaxID=2927786 RepID=A0AAE3QH35_9HYPH|nr:hypothetical protein [Fererhizobium litorale]MDI7864997.1 hypothetical protein [Fererhizobium litorale]MDI7925090.1 hypothetical protein [Fererhizobium litorale]